MKRHAALLTIADTHHWAGGCCRSFPCLMQWHDRDDNCYLVLAICDTYAVPLSFIVVFYANYLLLIPRILFRESMEPISSC